MAMAVAVAAAAAAVVVATVAAYLWLLIGSVLVRMWCRGWWVRTRARNHGA